MARLNESTAPVEPIEILKRRFVRQNREIARVNSIQSLRIRSLESEVSHLLSENVSLREQSISLSQELERYEAAKMLHDGVYDVKAKIDSKLAELNNIVADLGALPRKCGKLYQEPTESSESRHSRPSSFDLRRRAADTEYNATPEDGRLPIILEDKCYPRKSLELQELDSIVQNAPDTPGSPVIEDISPHEIEDDNHFIDPKLPGGLTDFQIIDPGPEEMDTLLPPTLETRRKRKPSPIATSKTEHALDPEPTITHRDLKLSTKPGAKRKFVSEDEEIFESTSVDEDDFQYTRPSHLQHQEDQPTPAHIENSPSKKQVDKKRGSRENGPSKRKVLEPKSTNHSAGPQSKLRASQDQKAQSNTSLKDENYRYPTTKKDHQISDKTEKPRDYNFDQNTSKDENTKSLTRYEPSKENPNSPASDMPNDEASNPARPSRRQRAVVSYAEPNLRDKMRRPTNEFADAVKTGDARRNSSTRGFHAKGSDGDEGNRGGRQDSPGLDALYGAGTVSQRKRKTLPANTDDPASIYDNSYEVAQKYHVSSTQDQHATLNEGGKQSRRHSSNPRSSRRVSRSQDGDDYLPQAYPQDGSDIDSMTTDKHMSGQSGDVQLDTEQDASSGNTDGKQIRRGQRGGARRRSMML